MKSSLKISIITSTLNSAKTIEDCIKSILLQSYSVEHIIIDGCSTDGTIEIIKKYEDKMSHCVSEPDKSIYWNKCGRVGNKAERGNLESTHKML